METIRFGPTRPVKPWGSRWQGGCAFIRPGQGHRLSLPARYFRALSSQRSRPWHRVPKARGAPAGGGAALTWQAGPAAGHSQRGQRPACGARSQPWAVNSVPRAWAVPAAAFPAGEVSPNTEGPAKVTELTIPQARPPWTWGRAWLGEKPEIPSNSGRVTAVFSAGSREFPHAHPRKLIKGSEGFYERQELPWTQG